MSNLYTTPTLTLSRLGYDYVDPFNRRWFCAHTLNEWFDIPKGARFRLHVDSRYRAESVRVEKAGGTGPSGAYFRWEHVFVGDRGGRRHKNFYYLLSATHKALAQLPTVFYVWIELLEQTPSATEEQTPSATEEQTPSATEEED